MQVEAKKEKILKTINELPEKASIEDAMERLYILYKVEKGLKQADEGKVITHEDAKTRLNKWLK